MSNRLSTAHSLYLRQHGNDPVDWYPWGEEAFARAEEEDRPILLSIGYASCHWCHVMAEESFSDPEIAELMNRLFVNVKVDREERPDVDAIHMRAVQSLTGRGGWPMTVFLTPEGVPFHGGTYYPPNRRHGLPAFRELLEAIAEAWTERRPALLAGAGEMRELLRRSLSAATPALPEGSSAPAGDVLALGVTAIEETIDPVHGGMASPQKFPQSSLLDLLLHAATGPGGASGAEDPGSPLGMALHWSRALLRGGIHDHLGGGFHRYTVDPRWDVPHFEKLLPDQALLARSLHAGWLLSGDPELRAGAEATILHLLEDLRLEEGGFAASLDADSEGREGAFYLWDPAVLARLLTPEEQVVFHRHFTLVPAPDGDGSGVLRRLTPFRRGEEEEPALDRLREFRSRRPHPSRDPKMVTGWNALAIRALCEIGTSFERPEWVSCGETALDLLLDPFLRTGTLPRIFGRGAPGNPGLLEDHAALGNALLSLHEATLSTAALDQARAIASVIRTRFWDERDGLLFDTDGKEERLVIRPRDPSDGATPSGTSMALEFWQRIAALTGDPEGDRERIARVLQGERLRMLRGPLSVPGLLIAADRKRRFPTEIVILGGDDPNDRAPFLVQAHRAASPFRVITGEGRDAPLSPVGTDDAGGRRGPRRPPLLEGRRPPPVGVTALVCKGGTCSLPLSAPEGLRSLAEG